MPQTAVTLQLYHFEESHVWDQLTECDGFQVDGIYKVAEQRPLETEHIPTEDLIAAAHGSQPLAVLNPIPGGHNGTWLHRDGSFTWNKQQHSHRGHDLPPASIQLQVDV